MATTVSLRECALVIRRDNEDILVVPYTTIENVEGGVASVNGVAPNTDGAVTIPTATTSASGVMSSADKTKLNSVATGANKYTVKIKRWTTA